MIDPIEAVLKNDIELLRACLASGADADLSDKVGRTALIHATIDGREEFVEALLNHGADPTTQDSLGFSPLHYAAQGYFAKIAAMLIACGAPIDLEDAQGNTPLFRAVFHAKNRPEVVHLLLDSGADRNHKNKEGISPVELAKSIPTYKAMGMFEVE
ncbi:hypothetical protein BH09SUM1_BH09SUM1_25080 [soil metagenome]